MYKLTNRVIEWLQELVVDFGVKCSMMDLSFAMTFEA